MRRARSDDVGHAMEDEDVESDEENKTVERKAHDLVRIALFTEYRRTPLKRDEIVKKVFGTRVAKGDFDTVLERAQTILRDTFGMELYEIMSRAERDRADAARDGIHGGESNGPGIKRKLPTAASKQYILRSILSNTIIEAASVYDVEIDDAEHAERALWPVEDEDTRHAQGTLFSWTQDQLSMAGILHVLLALILVNGRALSDAQLRTYLKRLRLAMGSPIPSSASQTIKTNTIDAYLAQLVKQSYLDKSWVASAQGGQKRTRGGDGETETSFEWKWGTRAIAEIGEEGVSDFLADFMMENGMGKTREKILTGVRRAAGGGCGYGGLL